MYICSLFISGLRLLLAVTGVIPGTREECLVALKNGYLVSISPGGVREALFSDESYQLMWGNRKGFAQVALEAKVVSAIHYQPQFMLSAYLLHYKMQPRSICWKIFQEKLLGNKDFISFSHRFPQAYSFTRSKSFVELFLDCFKASISVVPHLQFHRAGIQCFILIVKNLHYGPSPFCPKVSFFFSYPIRIRSLSYFNISSHFLMVL